MLQKTGNKKPAKSKKLTLKGLRKAVKEGRLTVIGLDRSNSGE